jgi:class 3 adenylate cyclase
MSESRRLSTILFADIAGYTALMQANEAHALSLLGTFQETLEREVSRFEGEIVQYFGDGCMLSFHNSSQAVFCSLALQEGFNDGSKVPVRIGMHLGEVVFKDGNAFGDGVNIAARIESLGIPGSILLSKAVRDQIRNKPDFELVSLGSFDFVNVEEPMEVFALANSPLVIPRREEMKGKVKEPASQEIPWYKRRIIKRTARNLAIYLLTAWLVVEAFAFLVKQKDLDVELVNLLMIVAVYGVGLTVVFSTLKRWFGWKATSLGVILVALAFASIFNYVLHPNQFDPGDLRIIKLVNLKKDAGVADLKS